MKKILSSLLILAAPLTAFSSVFDPVSRMTLADTHPMSRIASDRYTSMILEIEDESAIDDLAAKGAVVLYRRDNLLLVCIPENEAASIEGISQIKRASISRKASLSLDKAVTATRSDLAIAGENLPGPFTGMGVTVGFSDIGFDPGHAAFAGRVAKVAHINDIKASITRYSTPEEISSYTTDSEYEFHATHVAGILAGNDPGSPYRGIARDASIVATTSTLMDVGILAGVEEVIAAAKEAGQPAVVNLSLGSTIGPHDGSDLFCRYLDLCADDAAILLASGNDGTALLSASHVFTSETPVMQLVFDSYEWDDLRELNGVADIWCSDSSPIEIRLSVIDLQERKLLTQSDWMNLTKPGGDMIEIKGSGSIIDGYFEGSIALAGEVNSENSRSNTAIELALYDTQLEDDHPWARHLIGIEVKADIGSKVDITIEGIMGFRKNDTAFSNMGGSPDLSVSSLACGHKTICVGSSTTRDATPLLHGGTHDWSGFVQSGTVSHFTSYGTLNDGRTLPHFCAPGAYIISAYNRYAVATNPDVLENMTAVSSSDPQSYYFAECGTSMATPHAAGIMALWLQAEPTLSSVDLRDIAISTAHTDGVDPTSPKVGAGVIDALAGLRHILASSGRIDEATELIQIRREGDRIVTDGADLLNAKVEVYTPSGVRVNPQSLPHCPVIVRVATSGGVRTVKLF